MIINNSNKKILIIPDVHTYVDKAESIISKEKPDLTIFLGDYFDQFNDDELITRKTVKWFRNSINQKDRIHITGNHDIHYRFNNHLLRCSGFAMQKYYIINDNIEVHEWNKLVYFVWLPGNWLLTHAGLHNYFIPIGLDLGCIPNWLENESKYANNDFEEEKVHWFSLAGFSRGGRKPFGGILWLDFDEEFSPIKGINQICGHTPRFPHKREKNIGGYRNFCIDTNPALSYYAIYNNKKVEIKKT